MSDQHTNRYITHFQDPLPFLYAFFIKAANLRLVCISLESWLSSAMHVACTSIDVDDYFHLMKSLDYILRFNDNNSSQSNKAY